MQTARLADGTEVFCLLKTEAVVLDHHVAGYLEHGIHIPDDGVVFDVGANIGVFGVRTIQRHPQTRVYAFEPVPPIFAVLKANAERYGQGRFFPFAMGLSRAPGTLSVTYFPNSPALSTGNPGMWDEDPDALRQAVIGSVRNAPPELSWAKYVPDFIAGFVARRMRKNAQVFPCPLQPLSAVVKQEGVTRIDLLKIDCEGAELEVLLGIDDADWPKIQQVVVEVHDRDGRMQVVQDLLRRHGFTQMTVAQEPALTGTCLHNLYALRTAS